MEERSVGVESMALATMSLANRLLITLVERGVLSRDDAKFMFADAIAEQSRFPTPTNADAAYLLEQTRDSLERVWTVRP